MLSTNTRLSCVIRRLNFVVVNLKVVFRFNSVISTVV